jgi:ankyrin repeat protein
MAFVECIKQSPATQHVSAMASPFFPPQRVTTTSQLVLQANHRSLKPSAISKGTAGPVSTIAINSPSLISQDGLGQRKSESIFRLSNQVQLTEHDDREARELMARCNSNAQLSFTYKEATVALAKIAEGTVADVTPGLVVALLKYDADVNLKRRKSSNLWKRISDKDQIDVRSNLLEMATQKCSSEVLLLLAQEADEMAVNQALPHAIMQNDLDKVRILLSRGANANSLCSQFAHTLESGPIEIIQKLMSRTQGACQDCRDKGLVRAATSGDAEKVNVLLHNGANVAFENAAALVAAIRCGWDDIATAIACHGKSIIPVKLLDDALGEAYKKHLLQTVESCLEAGAKGARTDTTLIDAVRRGQLRLVLKLVQHGAAVDHESGAAVISAVQTGKPEMLQVVLMGKPCSNTMATAIDHSANLGNIQVAQQMIRLILGANFRGDAISHFLLQALNKQRMEGDERIRLSLVRTLLAGGADVNLQSGLCLRIAATEGWVNILSELFQYHPSVEAHVSVLRAAMNLPPIARKQMITMVLQSVQKDSTATHQLREAAVVLAAESLHVDVLEYLAISALPVSTIQRGFDSVISTGSRWLSSDGLQVVQFFLNQGASGKSVEDAFCHAAVVADMDAVELLATALKSKSALNKALADIAEHSTNRLFADDRNTWLVDSLLAWGAHGDSVNQALLSALRGYTNGVASEALLVLLLEVGNADVNFQFGEALKIAARSGNVQLLTYLASTGATKETMGQAFFEALRSPLQEDTVVELTTALLRGEDRTNRPDLNVVPPDRQPAIFECLFAHPNSAKIVKHLAKLGCDLDAEITAELCEVKERANALCWALRPFEDVSFIPYKVIETLIDLKGEH